AHVNPMFDERIRKITSRRPPNIEAKVGIPLAIRTGKSELLKKVKPFELLSQLAGETIDAFFLKEVSRMGLASMMTVPLVAHGQILGAISMYVGSERPAYESSDLALAEEISRR